MAAGDMANGHFDAQARYAALDERVTNLRTSMVNLEGEMRSGFTAINSHLTSMSSELRSSQKTQWPVIWGAAGVVFSVLLGIGAALYTPIQNSLTDQKADLKDMREGFVPRSEIDWRAARGAEDRERTSAALIDLRATTVARSEWQERNMSRDKELETIRADTARDLAKSDLAIAEIRATMTPRSEREMILQGIDRRFADVQRQLDLLTRRALP